jgi:hypothetical protein
LPEQHLSIPTDAGGDVHCAGHRTLQMLRDVGSGLPVNGADDVRSPRLAAISRHACSENQTEFCCILSGITFLRAFHAMHADVEPARGCERSRFRPANPVKIRCFTSTQ